MGNRIRLDTERMDDITGELKKLARQLETNATALRRVDFQKCGNLDLQGMRAPMLNTVRIVHHGGKPEALVRSYASALIAFSVFVNEKAEQVHRAALHIEELEHALAGIQPGAAEEAVFSDADADMKVRPPKYENGAQILDAHREGWEANNTFIDTEYDKKIKESLRELILNDPSFSETEWKKCKTLQEKQVFLREAMLKINDAMGTRLSRNLYLTDQKGTATVKVYIRDAVYMDVELPDTAGGGYYRDLDCVILRIDENSSFVDIIGTLCHENRHNLQQEMRTTKDLENSPYVASPEEYRAVADEVADWGAEYFSYDEEALLKETSRRYAELPWYEKIIVSTANENRNNIYKNVWCEYYERYAKQANEVDARYMEEYAESVMRERRRAENPPWYKRIFNWS